MVTGASFVRGRSKQDYSTPRELLDSVEGRFGLIAWDLAATTENKVALSHFGPGSPSAEDALAIDWINFVGPNATAWLNPPFGDIAPWAARCAELRYRAGWTLFLVPASVGSNWWAEHVHGKSMTYWLSPRLKFGGCDQPYPKDIALCAFGFGAIGTAPWRWTHETQLDR